MAKATTTNKKIKTRTTKPFRPNWIEYNKLLQHPKWQKRRLKVFERDKWMCKVCNSKTKTLHLHHKKYTKKRPWNEPMKNLETLCFICHKKGHKR